jgi:hypothetical protein
MAIPRLLPVGPWACTTCGRELLLIVDADSPPGIRETIRDQCGTEHFAPGRILGFFWKSEEANWREVAQPQVSEEERMKQPYPDGSERERRPKIA